MIILNQQMKLALLKSLQQGFINPQDPTIKPLIEAIHKAAPVQSEFIHFLMEHNTIDDAQTANH